MTVLAALLIAIGVADLVRSLGVRRPVPVVGLGILVLVTAGAGLLTTGGGVALTVLAAAGVLAWLVTAEQADHGHGHARALAVVAGAVLLQLACSG